MRRRELLLGVLALLVFWQVAAWAARVSILPGPVTVLAALVREVPRGLGRHFLVSGGRVVASIALAMLLAVPAGLALGQSRTWIASLRPSSISSIRSRRSSSCR